MTLRSIEGRLEAIERDAAIAVATDLLERCDAGELRGFVAIGVDRNGELSIWSGGLSGRVEECGLLAMALARREPQ